MKVVAVSGGFDPVCIGHVRMFKAAKDLGDKLIVILNSDRFLLTKKKFVFMPYEERKEILQSIRWVDGVVDCIDSDQSVCMTLERIKDELDIMADRFSTEHMNNLSDKDIKILCDECQKKLVRCNKSSNSYSLIFANGGDRKNEDDILEAEVCRRIGCEMIFGVGGEKISSSSELVNNLLKNYMESDLRD